MTDPHKTQRGPKGGICSHCERETGNLIYHEKFCRSKGLSPDTEALRNRSVSHAMPAGVLRPAQRWLDAVKDEEVALAMLLIERGVEFKLTAVGRWVAVKPPVAMRQSIGRKLSYVIKEMIRTGLLRHYVERHPDHVDDYLIPALVHVDIDGHSACLFTGEDLGPMRARLTDDLSLVDCLECEQAVARGHARGL